MSRVFEKVVAMIATTFTKNTLQLKWSIDQNESNIKIASSCIVMS